MSGIAVVDLNTHLGPEMNNGSSSKNILIQPCLETINGNMERGQCNKPACLLPTSVNGDEPVKSEVEVVAAEVEYIESGKLTDVEDVDLIIETILDGLDSKDWVLLCETLNNVRRLSIFHKETMLEKLEKVLFLILKSLKNPRSAVCKTAIMTAADMFSAYSDQIIDFLDPLLVQLLLKASQDKRFVCEAAVKALTTLTTSVSPSLLLPKLLPNLKHKNPRIRAKASMCFSQSVPHLGAEGIKAYGFENLIKIGATQLSDQLPESREAARTLLLHLQTVYKQSNLPATDDTASEVPPVLTTDDTACVEPVVDSWEHLCQSNLSALSAQAVLRVTHNTQPGTALQS